MISILLLLEIRLLCFLIFFTMYTNCPYWNRTRALAESGGPMPFVSTFPVIGFGFHCCDLISQCLLLFVIGPGSAVLRSDGTMS